jgi:cell division transport system permease protein
MIGDWVMPSTAEARLLGDRRLRGATPWVIAIMTFSIVVISAAGLALANTAGTVSRSAAARYSVQIPAGDRSGAAVLAALRSASGVTEVREVPEEDMRATLARWMGKAAESRDLPVPTVVHFDIADEASLDAVERVVRRADGNASVTAHRETLKPLLHSLGTLQWVALGLVLLLAVASAAAVVLAARGALDTHRSTIDVMHGIGATDEQVTRLFQRKIAIEAMIGSAIGGLAAGGALGALATGGAFLGDLTGGATLGWSDVAALALLPLMLTILATIVARSTVMATLRDSL